MTNREAEEAERLWSAYHVRQESLRIIQPFGLTQADLDGQIALGNTERDAVRLLLEKVASESPRLHLKKMAYSLLAVRADEDGRPFRKLLTQAAYTELLRLKQSRVLRVEIRPADHRNSCSVCGTQAKTILDIDEALHVMPIPHSGCTCISFNRNSGFCRCHYTPDFSHYGK